MEIPKKPEVLKEIYELQDVGIEAKYDVFVFQ